MPLNSIPVTVDVEALDIKRQAAAGSVTSTSVFGGSCQASWTSSFRSRSRRVRIQVLFGRLWTEGISTGRADGDATGPRRPRGAGSPLLVHAENRPGPCGDFRRCTQPAYADYLAPVSARGAIENLAIARGDRGRPPHRGRTPHLPFLELRVRHCPIIAGQTPRWRAAHRRVLPALPGAVRGGDRRRRHLLQVLTTDSGSSEPGAALGRSGRGWWT